MVFHFCEAKGCVELVAYWFCDEADPEDSFGAAGEKEGLEEVFSDAFSSVGGEDDEVLDVGVGDAIGDGSSHSDCFFCFFVDGDCEG